MQNITKAVREAKGEELSVEDMNMIADINRIRMNQAKMSAILKENSKSRLPEKAGKYTKIQQECIQKYKIIINEHSSCRGRMHAHVKERKICKWKPKNSVRATFDLLHEIGHVETHPGSMRRCESEYAATQWAIARFKEYKLEIPEAVLKKYQEYIWRELDRGLRRGGKNLPSRQSLQLKV